jgi:hypothetical protein
MITIESNVLQVARNFEQQIRQQPNIVKTALGRTAEFLMFLIKQRTAKGKDYQGNSFVKYTPEYARVRKAKGLPTTPDLFFKGNMMSGMTQRSSPTQAQITFSSVRENSKALWNQKTRKFFAIGDKEAPLLKNKFMDEYNRLMKI